jgi:3-isopropylmalate/(R)-2-methylmalate dehydratase small subunit
VKKFEKLRSRIVSLPIDNIDTDQIIPARFLKTTTKDGLGRQLFHDWRYDANGKPRTDFVLNQPQAMGAEILLAGHNFGCGSSREHAPWALTQYGIRAVISTSFADIFRQNALKNSLLPIEISPQNHRELLDMIAKSPDLTVMVDLLNQVLVLPDGRAVAFPVDAFAKKCLLEGIDELEYVLSLEHAIEAYEASHRRAAATPES